MTAAFATNAAQAVSTAVATVTVTKPAGTVAGDLLVAYCWANNNTAVWTPPLSPAWSNGDQAPTKGSAIFYRFADGSEGADFAFVRTVNTTAAAGVSLVRVSGAGSVVDSLCSSSATGANNVLVGVTATQANTLLLQFANTLTTTADTWAPPGTATERVEGNSSGTVVRYAVGDEIVGSGATGNRTWTHTNGQTSKGAMVAITSAAAPTVSVPSISTSEALGAPTVAAGTVAMSVPSIAPDGAVGAPVVSPGAVALAVPSIGTTSAPGVPTVSPGAVALAAPSIASDSALGAPTVAAGSLALAVPSIVTTTTVPDPTVAPGSVAVGVPSISTEVGIGVPSLLGTLALIVPSIGTGEIVPPPTLATFVSLTVPSIASGAAVGEPSLASTSPRGVTMSGTLIPRGMFAALLPRRWFGRMEER